MNSPHLKDVETKDVHVRFTRIAAGIFVLSIIGIAFGIFAFYRTQIHQWRDLSTGVLARQFPNPKVYWPNAKPEPVKDLDYHWLNDERETDKITAKSRAEIPVNRAIELITARHLLHISIETGQSDAQPKDKN